MLVRLGLDWREMLVKFWKRNWPVYAITSFVCPKSAKFFDDIIAYKKVHFMYCKVQTIQPYRVKKNTVLYRQT